MKHTMVGDLSLHVRGLFLCSVMQIWYLVFGKSASLVKCPCRWWQM